MGDCSDEAAITATVAKVVATHQHLDILVNNAGNIMRKPATETTSAEWLGILDSNLNGAFYLAREAAKPMIKQKSGRIINTLSALSVMGRAGVHAYTSSKHALHGLTKS